MKFDLQKWIKRNGKNDYHKKLGRILEKYYNIPVVDVMKELSNEVIEIIKKLGIKLENKICTEYEFDIIEGQVFDYYIFEGMTEDEKAEVKSLDGTGISQEDVAKAMYEIDAISEKHHF